MASHFQREEASRNLGWVLNGERHYHDPHIMIDCIFHLLWYYCRIPLCYHVLPSHCKAAVVFDKHPFKPRCAAGFEGRNMEITCYGGVVQVVNRSDRAVAVLPLCWACSSDWLLRCYPEGQSAAPSPHFSWQKRDLKSFFLPVQKIKQSERKTESTKPIFPIFSGQLHR